MCGVVGECEWVGVEVLNCCYYGIVEFGEVDVVELRVRDGVSGDG